MFLVNVPVLAVVVGLGAVVLPESRNPRPGRVDPLSVVLSVVGVVGVVYAVKEGAHGGVGRPGVVAALVVGVVALVVFARRPAGRGMRRGRRCGGGAGAAVGFGLFAAALAVDASFWSILPAMLVYGTGVGFAFAVTNDTVLASVPRERAGAAALPAEVAGPLVAAARQAYVDGAATGLWVCAGLLVVLAAVAGRALRAVPKVIGEPDPALP
ncbi:MFS transporter [Saccharothrix australiensis]|uniref:MFS transporter n=1 Tax=Saccharothrix australiensis TaxID=2072 RepID=UPI0011C3DA2A|nr:MFS transporter [Saccharothrix australiensis]